MAGRKRVAISGAGNMKATGTLEHADISLNGAGNADFSGVAATKLGYG